MAGKWDACSEERRVFILAYSYSKEAWNGAQTQTNDIKTSPSVKMQMNGDVVGLSCASSRLSGLCHRLFIHLQPQTCKTLPSS